MVGDILVEASPDDFCLEEEGKLSHLGIQGVQSYSWGLALILYYSPSFVKIPLILCVKGCQVDCTSHRLTVTVDFHRLQQQVWTQKAERSGFESTVWQLCDLGQIPPLGLFLHL